MRAAPCAPATIRLGGVSIPSTEANTRSPLSSVPTRWTVALSASGTERLVQRPVAASRVIASSAPDTLSSCFTHRIWSVVRTSSTTVVAVGFSTTCGAPALPAATSAIGQDTSDPVGISPSGLFSSTIICPPIRPRKSAVSGTGVRISSPFAPSI